MPPGPTARLEDLSKLLGRTAELVAALGSLAPTERYPAHEHREVDRVIAGFERINQTLEKAIATGHVTAVQQRSVASALQRIAEALEKAAGSTRR